MMDLVTPAQRLTGHVPNPVRAGRSRRIVPGRMAWLGPVVLLCILSLAAIGGCGALGLGGAEEAPAEEPAVDEEPAEQPGEEPAAEEEALAEEPAAEPGEEAVAEEAAAVEESESIAAVEVEPMPPPEPEPAAPPPLPIAVEPPPPPLAEPPPPEVAPPVTEESIPEFGYLDYLDEEPPPAEPDDLVALVPDVAKAQPDTVRVAVLHVADQEEAAISVAMVIDTFQNKQLSEAVGAPVRLAYISHIDDPTQRANVIRYRAGALKAALQVANLLPWDQTVEPMNDAEQAREGVDVIVYLGAALP